MKFTSYNNYKKTHLNETYESFTELYELASDIVTQFKKFSLFRKVEHNKVYNLLEFTSSDKYDILKDFVENGKVGVMYASKKADIHNDANGFLVLKKYFKDTFSKSDYLEQNFEYIIVSYTFSLKTFLHELEHAYDYYRAKNKQYDSKQRRKFSKKRNTFYELKDKLDKGISGTKPEIENFLKKIQSAKEEELRSYLRQSDELSAYFVQTVSELQFFVTFKKKNYMRSLNTLWFDFKMKFPGFDYLTPKIQKNLSRKFSQFYYKIKEQFNAEYLSDYKK